MVKGKKTRFFPIITTVFVVAGLLMSGSITMPVRGADRSSYNAKSFWYYPWGRSVTHKGVDIFAAKGTPVVSSTPGVVIYCGGVQVGGNVVLVLGPKWRVHYYAHLETIDTSPLTWVDAGDEIASVGNSGNAKGKQPHLHYSIATLIPLPWKIDASRQGWKKTFYINPIPLLGK